MQRSNLVLLFCVAIAVLLALFILTGADESRVFAHDKKGPLPM